MRRGLLLISAVALLGCAAPSGSLSVKEDITSTKAGADVYKQVTPPADRVGMNPKDLVAASDAVILQANQRIREGCQLREADRLALNPKGPPADPCTSTTPPPAR